MVMLLFRSAIIFCSSCLLDGFLTVLVASGILSLVYKLFTVKGVYYV